MIHDNGVRTTHVTAVYELSSRPFRAPIEPLVHCRGDNLIATQEAFYHFHDAFNKFSLVFFWHNLCFNREVFRHVVFYHALKLKLVQPFADWVFANLFCDHDRNLRPCLPLAFHVYTPGLEDRPAPKVPELRSMVSYGDKLHGNKKLPARISDQLEHKALAALEVMVTHCSIQPTSHREEAGGGCRATDRAAQPATPLHQSPGAVVMPRDLILDSFAGGGGSDATTLRLRLELDLFMQREEHDGNLTSCTQDNITTNVAIDPVKPKVRNIGCTFDRIDYHERARTFHVTHVTWKRSVFTLYPYIGALHVRVVFNIYQLSVYHFMEPINVCSSAAASDPGVYCSLEPL